MLDQNPEEKQKQKRNHITDEQSCSEVQFAAKNQIPCVIKPDQRQKCGRGRDKQFHAIDKCGMPDDSCISPVKQKEKRIDENNQRISHRHVQMPVKVDGKAFNQKIRDDACNKNNENVDHEYNPSRQITHVAESLFGSFAHDVFKGRSHSSALLA